MTEERPRPQNKTQFVYDFVMEGIVDGRFAGGSSLSIAAIAEETGVSLIPTREALRRLESEGLVEFVFHRGVRVSQLTIEKYREIMQAEAVLEGLAVGMAAPLLIPTKMPSSRTIAKRAGASFRSKSRITISFSSIRIETSSDK